jgi:hypothetical protein
MSSFERVKKNILREMEDSMTHTAASWARIMLNNTSRLTNVEEQKKFWAWMVNPEEDESVMNPVCEQFTEHCRIDEVEQYDVPMSNADDEKAQSVQMTNEYIRNGLGMYIKTKPVNTESSESTQSPIGQKMKCEEMVG